MSWQAVVMGVESQHKAAYCSHPEHAWVMPEWVGALPRDS